MYAWGDWMDAVRTLSGPHREADERSPRLPQDCHVSWTVARTDFDRPLVLLERAT